MTSIREQKLLYHLTSLKNLASILEQGLLPRSRLKAFHDVADHEILDARRQLGLESYVPFHWFSRNPFDGRVQKGSPNEIFVLLTISRQIAQARNWKVIVRHPLAKEVIRLHDYKDGINAIDWDLMDVRNYSDPACKSVCMAECLSPDPVVASDLFAIFVPTAEVASIVKKTVASRNLALSVTVNQHMFIR